MNALLESLTEITTWAGRTSVQACVLIVVILALQKVLGDRLTPRWRSALWLLLLVRLAMPWLPESRVSAYNLLHMAPQWAVPALLQRVPMPAKPEAVRTAGTDTDATARAEIARPAPSATAATPARVAPSRYALFPLPWLPLVWLAGMFVVLGCAIAQSLAMASTIRRHRFVTDENTLALLEDCKQQTGIHAYLAVVETERVTSPALFGIVRPRLLLPTGSLATLSREQLRHVFLHELAHLRRHDIAVNWIMTLLQALHWFNPMVWYAFARMRADRELACDALALSHTRPEESREYGRTFVHLLERYAQARRLPSLAGVLEKQNHMKRRIAMIARFHEMTGLRPFAVVLLFLALGAVTLTGAQSDPPKPDKAEMMGRVEDFFLHNFRDITARKSLEWGDVQTETSGTRSIRYMYEAKIWDKETIIDNRVFVFDRDGKVVSFDRVPGFPQRKDAKVWNPTTTEGMKELVEDFFTKNFRDITARENHEWGEVAKTPEGNYSIRYKYLATIWGKDKKAIDQTFTFDAKGAYVSVKNNDEGASGGKSHAEADVVIEKIDVTPYRDGGLFSLTVLLRNRGTATSPKFDVHYRKGKPDGKSEFIHGEGGDQAGPIEPGKSQSAACLPFSLREGQNDFHVVIDPGDKVLAESKSGHVAAVSALVRDGKVVEAGAGTKETAVSVNKTQGGPEITVEKFEVIPYPEGGLIMLAVTLRNSGSILQPPFEVLFYRGDPEHGGKLINDAKNQAGPIEPGMVFREASAPFAPQEGENKFFAMIDPQHKDLKADQNKRVALKVVFRDGKIVDNPAQSGDRPQSVVRTMRTEGELTFRDLRIRLIKVNENNAYDKNDDSVELIVRTPTTSEDRTIQEYRSELVEGSEYEINVIDVQTSGSAGQGSAKIEVRYRPLPQ